MSNKENNKKTPQRLLDGWHLTQICFSLNLQWKAEAESQIPQRHGEVEGIKKPMIFAFEAARLRRKKAPAPGDGCVATLSPPGGFVPLHYPVFVGFML